MTANPLSSIDLENRKWFGILIVSLTNRHPHFRSRLNEKYFHPDLMILWKYIPILSLSRTEFLRKGLRKQTKVRAGVIVAV